MASYDLAWEVTPCPFHCTLLVGAVATLPRFKGRRAIINGKRQGHREEECVSWEVTLEVMT